MKKLLTLLAFLLPFSASAAIATPWNATSTDRGFISPNLINGSSPWLVVSGTGTSTFAGPIKSTCFSLNDTSCLNVPSLPVSIPNGGTASTSVIANGVTHADPTGTFLESDSLFTFGGLLNSALSLPNGGSGSITFTPGMAGASQPGLGFNGFTNGSASITTSSSATRNLTVENTNGTGGLNFRVGLTSTTQHTLSVGTTTPGAVVNFSGIDGGTIPILLVSTSTTAGATTTALTIDQNGNLSIGSGAALLAPITNSLRFISAGAGVLPTGNGIATFINQTTQLLLQKNNTAGSNQICFIESTTQGVPGSTTCQEAIAANRTNLPASGDGELDFFTRANGNLGQAAVLSSVGYLGIGTTTPYAELSVLAGGAFTSQAASTVFTVSSSSAGTATSTFFNIDSSGNVSLPLLTGTQCLHEISGVVSGTGSDCGSGGAGVTSLQQTYGTAQTGALTLATTSVSFNGLTVANAITNSGGTFTISPLWSGTLNNAGLTNSAVTVNGTVFNLGDSKTITAASSTLLTDVNTWTNGQTFSSALTYGGVTLSNAVTGTGSMVLSAAPIFSGNATFGGTVQGGTTAAANLILRGTSSAVPTTANIMFQAGTGGSVISNITSQGLGIGTTSPFSELSISTTTQSSPLTPLLAVASTTNATLFNVLGGGNVGVGTTSPGTLFSVNSVVNLVSSGLSSFYGAVSFVASSATRLTLNGIAYAFPSSQSAGAFLQTDGSGNLSWVAVAASHYQYATTTAIVASNNTSTTTSFTIPAGVLTASSTITFSGQATMQTVGGNPSLCTLALRTSAGTTIVNDQVPLVVGLTGDNQNANWTGEVYSNNSTSAQISHLTHTTVISGAVGNITGGVGSVGSTNSTSAINFASALTLVGVITEVDSGTCTLNNWFVNIIP